MGGDFKKNFEKYQKNNEEVRFLMVGTLEPRKGHLDIINAIYFLNKNHKLDIRLDIIGNLGWHYENILKKIKYVKKQNCKVFFHSGVSDKKLSMYYSKIFSNHCGFL